MPKWTPAWKSPTMTLKPGTAVNPGLPMPTLPYTPAPILGRSLEKSGAFALFSAMIGIAVKAKDPSRAIKSLPIRIKTS